MALQGGRRGLAHLQDQADGLLVHGVLILGGGLHRFALLFGRRRDEERLIVLGLRLRLPEIGDAVDFGFGHEGPVQAR